MTKVKLLKLLVQIFMFINIAGLFIQIYFYYKAFISETLDYNINFNGFNSKPNTLHTKIAIALSMLNSGFLILTTFNFNKLITVFENKEYFVKTTITYLKNISLYVFYYSIIELLISCYYEYFDSEPIKSINFKILISLGVALFFYLLSEVFKKAKELKEENDLTV